MGGSSGNGWDQWQKHVLAELARQQDCLVRIERWQRKMALDVAMLKVKSGIWGAMGGLIPLAVLLAIQAWKN
jgi:hypothetical protein